MLKKIKSYIKTNELFGSGDKVILGVSGGADSVALLLVLSELKEELGITLQAVHINHEIRGEEALRDQLFTKELCERLGVPLSVFEKDVPKYAEAQGISLEEAGRLVRYEAFEEAARECGAERIAVAHHLDDNAETILFRIARGTGLKGLSGILPKRALTPHMTLVRPMLCVTRTEIEKWLYDRKESFCTDSTNLEEDYSRNKIRNSIIPALEELNSGAAENICALAEQALEAENYLDKRTWELYGDCLEFGEHKNESLIRIPENPERLLFERLIRAALFAVAKHEKDITSRHIRSIYELIEKQTGSRISLPYSVTAEKSYDCILLKKEDPLQAPLPGISYSGTVDKSRLEAGERLEISLADLGTFSFSLQEKCEIFSKQDYTKYFDYDKIKGNLEIRSVSDEDTIAISPEGGTKTVKKLFTDSKVPKAKRESQPIIVENNNVLWIPGLRTGENRRVNATTKRILVIEWRTKW